MTFVVIKRTGHLGFANETFGEVEIFDDDTIARLAQRASTTFQWCVPATQVRLFLMAVGEDDDDPKKAEEEALAASCLDARFTLAKAKVCNGSSLLALVPPSSIVHRLPDIASSSSAITQGKHTLPLSPRFLPHRTV